jgi:hypothetical protein
VGRGGAGSWEWRACIGASEQPEKPTWGLSLGYPGLKTAGQGADHLKRTELQKLENTQKV